MDVTRGTSHCEILVVSVAVVKTKLWAVSSVDVEEGKSHASYSAPEHLQEVVAHCLQTAEFIYLKPNASELKLSWENKRSVNTTVWKVPQTDCKYGLGVHSCSSNTHSPKLLTPSPGVEMTVGGPSLPQSVLLLEVSKCIVKLGFGQFCHSIADKIW